MIKLVALLLVAQIATPNASLQSAHRLFESRRFGEAVAAYKNIMANYPSSPETSVAAYYVGLSEERRGNRQAALAAHQAMVAKYPSSDLARFSKQRIIELQADLMRNPSGAAPAVVEQAPRPPRQPRPQIPPRSAVADLPLPPVRVVTPPDRFPQNTEQRNTNVQFPPVFSEEISVVNFESLSRPASVRNPVVSGGFPSERIPSYDQGVLPGDQTTLSMAGMNTTYVRRPVPDAHGEAEAVSISVADAECAEAAPAPLTLSNVPPPFEGISISGMINPYQIDRGEAIPAPPVTSWLVSPLYRHSAEPVSVERTPERVPNQTPPKVIRPASESSSLLEEAGQPIMLGPSAWEPAVSSSSTSADLPIMLPLEPSAHSAPLPIVQSGTVATGGGATSIPPSIQPPAPRTAEPIRNPPQILSAPARASDPAEAHVRRGIDLRKLGMEEKAIEEYRAALELAPNGPLAPIAKNNLADIFAERGENLEEAIRILTEALMLDLPDKGPYYSTLGWAYAKLGDYVNAEKFLNESMKTTVTAGRLYRRGRLYATMGMPSKARADLDRAFVYSEDAAMSAQIRKALESIGAEAPSIR